METRPNRLLPYAANLNLRRILWMLASSYSHMKDERASHSPKGPSQLGAGAGALIINSLH